MTLRKSRVVVHRRGDSGRGAKTVQFAAGIDDQFAPEQVSSFHRNRWSVSPGITVQFAPEYAHGHVVLLVDLEMLAERPFKPDVSQYPGIGQPLAVLVDFLILINGETFRDCRDRCRPSFEMQVLSLVCASITRRRS